MSKKNYTATIISLGEFRSIHNGDALFVSSVRLSKDGVDYAAWAAGETQEQADMNASDLADHYWEDA